MSNRPAPAAASTAAGPKPLVTATTRTRPGSPPAAAIRVRTTASRSATAPAVRAARGSPMAAGWAAPDDQGLALGLPPRPVGEVVGAAGRARGRRQVDVAHPGSLQGRGHG